MIVFPTTNTSDGRVTQPLTAPVDTMAALEATTRFTPNGVSATNAQILQSSLHELNNLRRDTNNHAILALLENLVIIASRA